ncbi:MAG TPA: metallophosphoesterase family protein, partial [Bryobacteraceae bacterium]|nr:metallophosphoesterase family protein [Bryobacteraceae bacterium]
MRPEAVRALAGVDLIVHAGDVGTPEILDALRAVAPLVAVRGNVDTGAWASALPTTAVAEAGGTLIYVLHDLNELDLDPAAAGFGAVVSGHTHKPGSLERAGVLYINPG